MADRCLQVPRVQSKRRTRITTRMLNAGKARAEHRRPWGGHAVLRVRSADSRTSTEEGGGGGGGSGEGVYRKLVLQLFAYQAYYFSYLDYMFASGWLQGGQ